MKEWKEALVYSIVEEARDCKIINLRDMAARSGFRHISAGDTRDILKAVSARLPDYRPVRMMSTEHDSLFQSLAFVDRSLEFDNGEDLT